MSRPLSTVRIVLFAAGILTFLVAGVRGAFLAGSTRFAQGLHGPVIEFLLLFVVVVSLTCAVLLAIAVSRDRSTRTTQRTKER